MEIPSMPTIIYRCLYDGIQCVKGHDNLKNSYDNKRIPSKLLEWKEFLFFWGKFQAEWRTPILGQVAIYRLVKKYIYIYTYIINTYSCSIFDAHFSNVYDTWPRSQAQADKTNVCVSREKRNENVMQSIIRRICVTNRQAAWVKCGRCQVNASCFRIRRPNRKR